VAGQRQLDRGSVNPQPAGGRVFDEDRLGEAQIGGYFLTSLMADIGGVEEDAERVAALPVLAGEDGNYMQGPAHIGNKSMKSQRIPGAVGNLISTLQLPMGNLP